MNHSASSAFWSLYDALPADVRAVADKKFEILKQNPRHPSLHFKKVGGLWSVRAGERYRALGHDTPSGVHWFWIGTHAEYDRLIR